MTKIVQISDIMTSDVIFYDSDFKDECLKFCNGRDIDCLPSTNNPQHYYQRNKTTNSFDKKELPRERIVCDSENIFSFTILERFKKNRLLFVKNNEEILGAVHFSDYDKPIVRSYLYELFFTLEKNVRDVLVAEKCCEQEVLDFFVKNNPQYSFNIDAYKRCKDNDKLQRAPFVHFGMADLFRFARSKNIEIDDRVIKLRNIIMHSKELVNLNDHESENMIYSFDSFVDFYERALVTINACRKITNKLRLKKEV